ncbi:DUF4129 domain-containing protein [Actinoplanes solisilvae]|uniref:DUF4129 domain-containing protein n=1 Tax=Actinoplanes solisilvae TaxID=2486853 RepID=UPI001F0C99C6|nr:DUF4129 domain-containing protein [Actinoplanes solisilvae]
MTRDYDEFLAGLFDVINAAWVVLIMLALAGAVGLLWYTYPAWLRIRIRIRIRIPRPRWKWKLPRFRRKPRKKKTKKEAVKPEPQAAKPEPETPSPLRPVTPVLSTADRLAAEGRYAEAIRERLRESVTALTRHGVITHAPAWTAQEIVAMAGANRPAVSVPLTGATDIFSEIWYGHRPAGPDQDARMRRLTAEVKAALETSTR